jgi:CDP-paratose 2-epimerase
MQHILITGICGFVGSTLAREFKFSHPDIEITGLDNFSRAGSWTNKEQLHKLGITIVYGDIRNSSDFETLPKCDWVIDAAANPSVLAGIDGKTSSYQLVQHNLIGTVNILEYCKKHNAGFTLLSTSRVYSIPGLANLQMDVNDGAFIPMLKQIFPQGISNYGVDETYSTQPPVSLYGSTKVTSEHLALEYGETFGFPVWINRCGVMAGAGQFGHPAQGIFAYWIHSFVEQQPLKYIGFGGSGHQVRDCMHPRDLVSVMIKQFNEPLKTNKPRTLNFSGGIDNSMSLKQLSNWCNENISRNVVESANADRPFDIPWMVLDERKAQQVWDWTPQTSIGNILNEINHFALNNKDWLKLSKQ